MPTLLLYIVKLSCSLSIAWLFYRLFLHNLTFYNLNRWYLLGYSLLSFIIPFINIGPIDREDPALQPLIVQYIPVIGDGRVANTFSAPEPSAWNWPGAALVLVAIGSSLLLLRLLVRCLSLHRMRRRADLLEAGQIKIYRVRDHISPFSFGNAIYINTSQHSEKEKEEIILHEYVHIRQRHTLDILLAEFITIFNWYNPFAWLIRYSIRQNLEFIADRQVVENGLDKKDYQYHLLRVIGQTQYRLANNFNFSSLKKRIAMMNKMRSARLNLVKFLFILPLLAALLIAFRDRYDGLWIHSEAAPVVNMVGIVFDLDGRSPISDVTIRDRTTGLQTTSDSRGFYKLSIPVAGDSAHIYLDFTKRGYDPTFSGDFLPHIKASIGRVSVAAMRTPGYDHATDYLSAPYMKKLPAEPGYQDALKAWKDQLKWNDDYAAFREMQKTHPDVTLIYTTEDKQKHLVIPPQQPATHALSVGLGQQTRAASADTVPPTRDTLAALNLKKTTRAGNVIIDPGPSIDSQHVQKNEPMYIIDGKRIFAADLNDINPNDISSLQVIKSAAAMAIYGPDARNGVIVITLLPRYHIQPVLDARSWRHPITVAADTLHRKNDSIRIWLRG